MNVCMCLILQITLVVFWEFKYKKKKLKNHKKWCKLEMQSD